MNHSGSIRIGTLLLLAALVFVTPVMATWIYTNYNLSISESEPVGIEINGFEYAPIVTLPGTPTVTTPPETEPVDPPEGSTPGSTTTPPPPVEEPELDGTNYYNLITLIVGSLQECLDEGITEEGYEAANLNHTDSYLYRDMIGGNKHTMHSAHTSSSGGNIVKALESANAHKLHFSVVMNSAEDEVVVYMYEAVGKGDEGRVISLYRAVGKKGETRWYPDLYSVEYGTAKVIKQSGKQIIDISSFVETPQT